LKSYSTTQTTAKSFSWNKIEPLVENIINVGNSVLGIQTIQFKLKNEVKNVDIKIFQYNSKDNIEEPQGISYKFIEIEHKNIDDENIKESLITFNVDKEWISNNSIDEKTIIMQRYKIGWGKLPTSLLEEKNDSFSYVTKSPGFSLFAITGSSKKLEKPNETKKEDTVGGKEEEGYQVLYMTVIIILTIIITFGWIRYHKKKKRIKSNKKTKKKTKRKR